MTRIERKNEIVAAMKSFSKETYHKTEVLPELLLLQKELVELVFDEEHAAKGNLKIWDVEKHLEQLSESNKKVAAEEIAHFEEGCKEICNRIKAEISGNWGEEKTFQRLENMKCSGKVIRNIELKAENVRTELDGIVVTPKAIFVVEVKNTKKDIFIDEEGNYYRTGDYMRLDSNIGEKMFNKVSLLKRTLDMLDLPEIKVESVLVFTNNRIEVNNKYKEIQTCFLGQLPYIIEEYKGGSLYSEEDVKRICQAIKEARSKESYKYNFDVAQFKIEFANILSLLEEASAEIVYDKEVIEEEHIPVKKNVDKTKKLKVDSVLSWMISERTVKYASTAALLALTIISSISVSKHN